MCPARYRRISSNGREDNTRRLGYAMSMCRFAKGSIMTGIILGIGNSAALFAPKGTPFDPKDVIELVDPEQPHVSVFDLSVLRGDGIFEATTVWKGFPVSLENHLRRLATSAAMTDLPEPNIDAFTAAVNTVIAAYDDPARARPDAAHPRLARLRSDHRRRRGQRPPAQRVDLPRRQGPAAFARAADHDLAVARLRVRRDREGAVAAQRREDAQLCDQPVRASAVRPSRHRRFDPVHDRRVHARMPEFVDRRPVRRYVRYTRPAHRHPQRHRSANCSRGRSKRARRSNTASCRWPNCAKPTICS